MLALICVLAGCASAGRSSGPAQRVLPGFDTSRYPGDEVLRLWKRESPYHWIGFYLPAPCHRETSWSGKRQTLLSMGWGIAILYVGQQAFEGIPPSDAVTGSPIVCSRALLSEERGRQDALDAANAAEREGFPRGSVIYQDIENMRVIPDSMRAYYSGWQRELLADGRYLPGTYAHHLNAVELRPLAEAVFREAGRSETPPFWVAGGRDFSLDSPAWSIGLPFVRIWQGALDVDRTWGGRTLRIDENVATSASPSEPLYP
ncbi:MAG TPA: glycoside hydrolase domain-containing protein [Longimicrobiaceae bacterium]